MSTRPFGFIRKLPSKRFQASYVGPDSKRYNAPDTFQTKTEARDWLAVESASIRAKTWVSHGDKETVGTETVTEVPTFKKYAERHIAVQTNHYGELLRESTKALYIRLLNTKLSQFHNSQLNEITSAQIADWWALSTANGERTSSSKAYKLLSAVMKRAVEESHLTANPCKVKGAQSAISGREVAVPTAEQVMAMATHINPRYSNMVLIKAYSGLRFGEITELRRKDLKKVTHTLPNGDLIACYEISVKRAVTLVGTKHVIARPKSRAGVRSIQVPSHVTAVIDETLNDIQADPEALLFPAAEGGNLRHDVFINSWNPAQERAGFASHGFTPHSLRHFAGTQLAQAGATIAEIKKWLGDDSDSAVMRYIHATSRTASLVEKMEVSF